MTAKYIVRHGDEPHGWYLQAPRTWVGGEDRATRFDTEEEAITVLDKMIEARYSPIATKKQMKAIRDKCVVVTASEQETV